MSEWCLIAVLTRPVLPFGDLVDFMEAPIAEKKEAQMNAFVVPLRLKAGSGCPERIQQIHANLTRRTRAVGNCCRISK